MTKLGQVEITSPEPYRWGTGLDGTATWSSSDRAGVYNFTELTINDNSYIKVQGGSGVVKRNLIIFATKKITIGSNVVIDANPRVTNRGRGASQWGSDTDVNSATINGTAPGIINNATWSNNSSYDWYSNVANSTSLTNQQFTSAISGGGGGGGGGHNQPCQSGGAGGSSTWKYTTGKGQSLGGNVPGYTAPSGGSGGTRGSNRYGDGGSNGASTSNNTIAALKEKFTYTGKGYFGDPNTGALENRDDFPVVNGGNGGHGGGVRPSRNINVYYQHMTYGGLGAGQITLIAPEIIFPDAPENAENIAIPEGGYREGWYPSWNSGLTHEHRRGGGMHQGVVVTGVMTGNPVLSSSKGYGWQVGDEIEAPYAYATSRGDQSRTADTPPKFRVNAVSSDGLGRVNGLSLTNGGTNVFEQAARNATTFNRNYPSSDLFLAATHDHDDRIQSTFGNVNSNAALLYARGQTCEGNTTGALERTYPGIDADTATEDGLGGQHAGGDGQYQGLVGKRDGDGGSGAGGGGGGGTVIIVYNKFRGHPTIRTSGGRGPGNKSGGNRGGYGGAGGHGITLIGWKSMNAGPITWVKSSHRGFKRGKKIQDMDFGYHGQASWGSTNNGLRAPQDEIYSGNQWPSLKNGEYVNDDGSST